MMMKVYMNTFCFLQDNEYAQNESQSYLGKRTFMQKIEIGEQTVLRQTSLNRVEEEENSNNKNGSEEHEKDVEIVDDEKNKDKHTNKEKRTINWELKKKQIDLANKNENIQPDFSVG